MQVAEGRVVAAGGDTCGARYRAKVIEGTKNASVGQMLEFGYAPSLKIGGRYLVLLDAYENVRIDQLPDFQARCKGSLPKLALIGLRSGAMEVTGAVDDPEQRTLWTVRREKLVAYPLGTRSTVVDGESQLVYTDLVSRMKGEK